MAELYLRLAPGVTVSMPDDGRFFNIGDRETLPALELNTLPWFARGHGSKPGIARFDPARPELGSSSA